MYNSWFIIMEMTKYIQRADEWEYVAIEESVRCPADIIGHFEKLRWRPRWPPFHDFRIVCHIMVHVYNKYYTFFQHKTKPTILMHFR